MLCLFAITLGCNGSLSSSQSADSPSTSPEDGSCGALCSSWNIDVQTIQIVSGTCSMNDCGYGAHGACSLSAIMKVEKTLADEIKLDPWIPGLLSGLYFEGTMNASTGAINTIHEAFPASTLLAGWDLNNDTMGGQIYWEPNPTCKAVIDFSG